VCLGGNIHKKSTTSSSASSILAQLVEFLCQWWVILECLRSHIPS